MKQLKYREVYFFIKGFSPISTITFSAYHLLSLEGSSDTFTAKIWILSNRNMLSNEMLKDDF